MRFSICTMATVMAIEIDALNMLDMIAARLITNVLAKLIVVNFLMLSIGQEN